MRLIDLAIHIAAEADPEIRWRLVIEFLEEYRWEPVQTRWLLLEDEPPTSGDERWDVLLAGLAEHLAAKDGSAAAEWTESRILRRFWFPFDTPVARALALVSGPAALQPPRCLRSRRRPGGRVTVDPLFNRAALAAGDTSSGRT